MPKKSVKEMSEREKKHYSLRGRTARAVLLTSAVLGLVMLLVGLGLYTVSLSRQYIAEAFNLTRNTQAIMEKVLDPDPCVREVMGIYHSMSEEELGEVGSEAYFGRFEGVKEIKGYKMIDRILRDFKKSSDVNDLYLGMYDVERSALVIIVDPEDSEDWNTQPGEWERVNPREAQRFMNWDGSGRLYFIDHNEKYGWICTCGVPICDDDGNIHGFVLADLTMEELKKGIRTFVWQYTIILLVTTILLAVILVRHMTRTLVNPINGIAKAAREYVKDKKQGINRPDRFANLQIRTGDEVENLCYVMQDMEQALNDHEEHLKEVTAEKERMSTELNLAKRIQEDMLPHLFPPFPERVEFDIYATMTPAKEVGGDFYDFFLLDQNRLGMVIADVSGKGIPGALFMMISKILMQNDASSGDSPAEVLRVLNEQICRNNREEMFVTLWYGILHLDTGRLVAANAGHEYPIVQEPGGEYILMKDKHGFVIGGMEDIQYSDYELMMKPGSRLFLYSDGLPEASNVFRELYGTDRVLDVLNSCGRYDSTKKILGKVKAEVDRFVGNAEPFDDMTMMCVQYLGKNSDDDFTLLKEVTVDAKIESVRVVTEMVDAELEAAGCLPGKQMQIDVAIDELVANIAHYAYPGKEGKATVRVERDTTGDVIRLTFIDSGIPYNPLLAAEPDVTLSAEERKIGGMGIFIVKKTMDRMDYRFENGQNILQIYKKIV